MKDSFIMVVFHSMDPVSPRDASFDCLVIRSELDFFDVIHRCHVTGTRLRESEDLAD